MNAIKILVIGTGIGELEALQRAIHLSGAHCAIASGSAMPVVDAEPAKPTEKMILEMCADYSPRCEPIIVEKYKEQWRKGRPLK